VPQNGSSRWCVQIINTFEKFEEGNRYVKGRRPLGLEGRAAAKGSQKRQEQAGKVLPVNRAASGCRIIA
jgi:hypothetical protein